MRAWVEGTFKILALMDLASSWILQWTTKVLVLKASMPSKKKHFKYRWWLIMSVFFFNFVKIAPIRIGSGG